MRQLVLYSTLGCHLCEEAKVLCDPLVERGEVVLCEVDIADSQDLMDTYGIRIPVLRDLSSGEELGWPFGAADLRVWLQSLSPVDA